MESLSIDTNPISAGRKLCCMLFDPRAVVFVELVGTLYAIFSLLVQFYLNSDCIGVVGLNNTFLKNCEEDDLIVSSDLGLYVILLGSYQCIFNVQFLYTEWKARKGLIIRGENFTKQYKLTQFFDICVDGMIIWNICSGIRIIDDLQGFSFADFPWVLVNLILNSISLLLSGFCLFRLKGGIELVKGRESVSFKLLGNKLDEYEQFLDKFKEFLQNRDEDIRMDMIALGIIRPSALEECILEQFWRRSDKFSNFMFQNHIEGLEVFQQRFIKAQNEFIREILVSDQLLQYVNDDASLDDRMPPDQANLPKDLIKELNEITK